MKQHDIQEPFPVGQNAHAAYPVPHQFATRFEVPEELQKGIRIEVNGVCRRSRSWHIRMR